MQAQDKIFIKEAIYASSERNIQSGSGFGYRTHSSSIDRSLLKDIAYHRVNDIPFDFEILRNNPKVVCEFPATFVFEPVYTENGEEKFVFRRSIFIGIEYGYFNEGMGGMRVGSNFLAHSLYFDALPPPEIFDILLDNNVFDNLVFQPIDSECRPDNSELKKLLVGEPELMPNNYFNLSKTKDVAQLYDKVDAQCGEMIIAALQYYFDAKLNALAQPSEEFRHILVKAPHAATNKLIWTVKRFLPPKFANHLYFATNFTDGNLPPYKSNIHLVFVNEYFKSGIYDDNQHIFLDTTTNETRKIDNNELFKGIRELINSGEIALLRQLLLFLEEIKITSSADFDSIYQLFILAKTDKTIALSDISVGFIAQLSKSTFASYSDRIWKNIGNSINKGLQSECEATVIQSIDAYILIPSDKIQILDKSRKHLTKLLFDTDQHFANIVNSGNVQVISKMIYSIDSFEYLFASLQKCGDPVVWKIFISSCIQTDEKKDYADTIIIPSILKSKLSNEVSCDLLLELYPLSKDGRQIFCDYFVSHPEDIRSLSKILGKIYMDNLAECSVLITKINNDQVFDVFQPIIKKYYRQKLEKSKDCSICFAEFVKFIQDITPEKFNLITLDDLMKDFVKSISENPSIKYKESIAGLLELKNVKINSETEALFDMMLLLINDTIPETVNESTMIFAYRLSKKNMLQEMFDKWLAGGLDKRALKFFIASAGDLADLPQLIEHMAVSVWNSEDKTIKQIREELVKTLLDDAKWDKKSYNEFIKKNVPEDLVAFLTKFSGIFNKLFGNLFKK